jgi:hypothetical protein
VFDIFGTKAKKDAQRGYADNAATATKSFADARAAQGSGYQEAQGYYAPYAQSGQKYNSLYEDALGVNGADGGTRAQAAYTAGRNPYLDETMQRNENALMRRFNSMGRTFSGASALAAARARQEAEGQGYDSWLSRLGQQQGQGAQIAGQQSSLAYDNAGVNRDLYLGEGQTKMDLRSGLTNALMESRNAGFNNLLKIAGTAAKAAQAYRNPKAATGG